LFKKVSLIILVAFCLASCLGPAPPLIDFADTPDLDKDRLFTLFAEGELRLSEFGLLNPEQHSAIGQSLQGLLALYEEEVWESLAIRVAIVNVGDSLSYYLLGRSAEELGYTESAARYYAYSRDRGTKSCFACNDKVKGLRGHRSIASSRLANLDLSGQYSRTDSEETNLGNNENYLYAKNSTRTLKTEFDPIAKTQGPMVKVSNLIEESTYALIRSQGESYQLYVKKLYAGDWRRYYLAYMSGGLNKNLDVISRDVTDCSKTRCLFEEHFTIKISREELESLSKERKALLIQISSRSGHKEVLDLPEWYVRGYIDYINL